MDETEAPPPPAPVSEREGDRRYAPPASRLAAPSLADDGKRGSLWVGFGLFWAIAACAVLVAIAVGLNGSAELAAGLAGLMALSPLLLCIWLGVRGRKRTALGILLGYASALALPLLLLSVCVGLGLLR